VSRISSIARAAPVAGAAVLLLGVLSWPLLFTYSGFAGDWDHQLWLLWHQSLTIEADHLPSLFLNSSYSVLYPSYAFYGGTLFALGGTLSLALGGSPVQAYILVYLLDFAAAFGGWYWLGRIVGLGRWRALVPGLVFVTSAYYVVVIYVQGDWPEFTGISAIPLMVAAALSILRAERLTLRAASALALSSVLFFASHNITILLGLTTIALASIAILAGVPDARRRLTRRGSLRVAGIVVPAAMVSAWYLLPVLAYSSSTRLASEHLHAREELASSANLVSLAHLFTFSRSSGPGLPPPYYLDLALPVLAVAWVLAGALLLPWRSRSRTWTRLLAICSGLTVLILVVMTHPRLLLSLPRPYTLIQFSYRLETYVLLALCGAILAALMLARGRSLRARAWTWMALPVCAVSLIGAIGQLTSYPYPGQDRYETLESYGEVNTGDNRDFQDGSAPVLGGAGLAKVEIPPEAVHGDSVSFATQAPPGMLLDTNIGAGPYLLHVTGAKAVGVDSETGDAILRVGSADGGPSGTAATQTITVGAAHSLPVVLGAVLSACGAAALVLQLLVLAARAVLSRRPVGDTRIAPAAPSAENLTV